MSSDHTDEGPAVSTPNPLEDYEAEATVNLRGQRLRRPEPTPADDQAAEPEETVDAPTEPDPYGVGQEALAANSDAQPAKFTARPRAGLFDPREYNVTDEPATWGARGRINAATGLKLRPKHDSGEVRFRSSVQQIQQSLPGCSVVAVANPKGGAGKTPTTVTLSATFGRHRGQGVVAWDASESIGTLGDRAARTTDPELGVWDVLEHAAELCSTSAVSGALGAFLRRQPTMDDILAADTSTTRDRGIGWAECAALMAVLRRHRDLIFIDTGNNPLAGNWQWTIAHADLLVIPIPVRVDMAKQAFHMLDGIMARGYGHLVSSAVVLLTTPTGADPQLESLIVDELSALGVQQFMQVGYEPMFAAGDRIVYDRLQSATVEAYTNIAALIADNLAELGRARTQQLSDPYAPEAMHRPPEVDVRTDRGRTPTRPYPVEPYEPPAPQIVRPSNTEGLRWGQSTTKRDRRGA